MNTNNNESKSKPLMLGEDSENYLAKAILLEEAISPKFIRVTIGLIAGLIVLFLLWAAIARLDIVARAPGKIVPSEAVQIVQHLDGGRIDKINVIEGQEVKKGDILISMNETDAVADLESLTVKSNKLKAEVDYQREVANIRSGLAKDKLVTKTLALDAQRSLSQVEGEYESTIFQINKLKERLSRMDIIAPMDGVVQELKYRTIGGVIPPGATVMHVVPTKDILRAELRVSTTDIGHVKVGQKVRLKMDTYDFMRYGVVEGKVAVVSAFSSMDEKNLPYFLCYVDVARKSLGKNEKDLPIMAGMTLQSDIVTDSQSVLRYLLRPIFVAFSQGMHER
jgi:RND family efflux transporter MFP subunit